MKKLIIIILSMGLVLGASAQRGHEGSYHRPHVHFVWGVYAPFYPYYGYSPFYAYPPYYNDYGYRPSRLTLKIEDIRNDYRDRIWSVKQDKSLTRKQRRDMVHSLRQERKRAIEDAKVNYYKTPYKLESDSSQ